MRYEYILNWHLIWSFFFLHLGSLYANTEESGSEYSKGCAHLHCESGTRCIKRRFWCKDPPCPGMLYCSKSRKESLKGPLTCETVRCSRGHVCIVRVRGCHWDENCKQQIARCISEKEYHEGAASCAGFKCPSGKRCILRETYCVNPPCKLIRSCAQAGDVQTWFDECRKLNCTSRYECFLRRPENNCRDSWCTHMPDCTLTIEDELISKYCYGWICPRAQKCLIRIIGSCKGFNCTIERLCHASSISKHDTTNRNDEVAEQPSVRKTLVQIESEMIRQKLERRTNTQTNYPITREKITSEISEESTFPDISRADGKIESATSHDTKRLQVPKKIYIATDDILPLPMVLEGINFASQGYPIWMKNDPYYSLSLDVKDEDGDGWRYHAPQEPYKILLPPYEPVILVEDMRRREKLLPLFTYAFDHPFNEAVLISLPEITSGDTMGHSKTDNIPTIVDDKIGNYINASTTVGIKNLRRDYFDDSSDDYANVAAMKKTNAVPSNIRNKELNNYYDDYEWRPWYMIYDHLERNEPQLAHEQGSKSNIDIATDNLYRNDTLADIKTFVKNEITNEKTSRVSEMRQTDRANKNFAIFDSPSSTGQSDYSFRDKRHYDFASYPYYIASIHDVDKGRRKYNGLLPNKILDISLNEKRNQRDIPIPFGEFTRRQNERLTLSPYKSSLYYTNNNNNEKNNDRIYDEY